MKSLSNKRRCRCGCRLAPGMRRFRFLDIFRWLGLAAVLCWQVICIVAGRVGRTVKDWASGNWEDLKIPSHDGGWKCDLCGTTGRGDASMFFALSEIEHFLEARCRGSLRPHDGLTELKTRTAELKARTAELKARTAESRDRLLRNRLEAGWLLRQEKRLAMPPAGAVAVGSSNVAIGWNASIGSELESAPVALDFGGTWVAAGQTININSDIKKSFKVQRLVIPACGADHFQIEELTNGRSQLLPTSGILATLFTSTSSSMKIPLFEVEALHPGFLTITITNVSSEGAWFHAFVMGPVLDSPNLQMSLGSISGGARIAAEELDTLLEVTGLDARSYEQHKRLFGVQDTSHLCVDEGTTTQKS